MKVEVVPFDGEAIQVGLRHRIGPRTLYLPHAATDDAIRALVAGAGVGSGETVLGSPGELSGASIARVDGGFNRLYRGELLGVGQCSGEELAERIQERAVFLKSREYSAPPTAGALAMAVVKKVLGRRIIKPIEPKWRAYFLAALSVGPIEHYSGGGVGQHIDREEAYLNDIPHGRIGEPCEVADWQISDFTMGRCRALTGVLPVRLKGGGVAYPCGQLAGVWPTKLIKWALECGHISEWKPELSVAVLGQSMDLRKELDGWPKWLRKSVYTRAVGKLSSMGSLCYARVAEPDDGTQAMAQRRIQAGFEWFGHQASIDHIDQFVSFRPEFSAAVYGRNMLIMQQAMDKIGRSRVIMAHVDALWYRGKQALPAGFRLEGSGEIRAWAQGVYSVAGGKLGASGWTKRGETPTYSAVDAWQRGIEGGGSTRVWSADPRREVWATSTEQIVRYNGNIIHPWYHPHGYDDETSKQRRESEV